MKQILSVFTISVILSLFSSNVTAQETEYALLNITPENGSKIDRFSVGDKIKFATNFDDKCGGFKVSIVDLYRQQYNMADSIVYSSFTADKSSDDNEWVIEFFEGDEVALMKDHEYKLNLEGHATSNEKSPVIATVFATYTGAGTDFVYSDVQILKIEPNEGSEYSDVNNNYFFITYSKDVNIDTEKSVAVGSDGKELKFEYWGNPYFEEKGKRVWQLNISKEILANATGEIKLKIYAKDLDGQVVRGNAGLDENSYQEIVYQCFIGYPQIEVFPEIGNIGKIAFLNFSSPNGISIKNPEGIITLYNGDKSKEIFTFKASDLKVLPEDNNVLHIDLPQTITEEGNYILDVPKAIFGLGTNDIDNMAKEFNYSIVDRMQQYGVDITPADNSVVNKLSTFIITFNKWDAANPYYRNQEKITLTDADGKLVTTAKASIDKNREKLNQCIITLDKEIETSGEYRLNIPYRAFIVDHTGNFYSEEMYFDYTVEEADVTFNTSINTTMHASDSSLEQIVIEFIDYKFTDVVNNAPKATITDANGNVLASGTMEPGTSYTKINVNVESGKITVPQVYYLHIPAMSLKLGNNIYTKEIVLPFNFNNTTGIDKIPGEDDIVKVYSISGILIGEGKSEKILKGLKGVYIVNGKKVVVGK